MLPWLSRLFNKVVTLRAENRSNVDVFFDRQRINIHAQDSSVIVYGRENRIHVYGNNNDILIRGANNYLKLFGEGNNVKYIPGNTINATPADKNQASELAAFNILGVSPATSIGGGI